MDGLLVAVGWELPEQRPKWQHPASQSTLSHPVGISCELLGDLTLSKITYIWVRAWAFRVE
jgi:hypothetical protein